MTPTRHAAVLSITSGALLALAFPSVGASLCAWIGLVPLFGAIDGTLPGRAFRMGWLAGATFALGTLYWVVNPINYYTDAPVIVAITALVLLAATIGVYFGLFAAALRLARAGMIVPLALAAPVCWVSMEWVRSVGPLAFPWVVLGYSQYRQHELIQCAEVTGVHGISALLVFANAVIYGVLRDGRVAVRSQRWGVAILAVLVGGLLLAGHHRLGTLQHLRAGGEVAVGVVQANVDQGRKWDPEFQAESVERHIRLGAVAKEAGADLVVWPETAVPFYFQAETPGRDRIVEFATAQHVDVLFGAPAFEYGDFHGMRLFNRAYLVERDGSVGGFYDKLQLVPFGEYVPFRSVLFFVDAVVEGVGNFVPGTKATVFSLPQGRFGVLICYEGIFPRLSRELVKRGAGFLVNITNDAWFGNTSAPYQHLAMVTLRAVENRVPIVRAANTGISAIVDIDGRVRWQTGLFEATTRTDTVSWTHLRTFYTQYGDVFTALCGLASVVLIGYAALVRRRRVRR
jgi:apolipoprotein N-acyltransferase